MRLGSLAFLFTTLALYGCSSIHDPETPTYTADPLCENIYQKMNPGTANYIPSHRTVTATEEANLYKEYNRLGCTPKSDNRYAFPNESLEINQKINEMPVSPPS